MRQQLCKIPFMKIELLVQHEVKAQQMGALMMTNPPKVR